MITVNQLMSVNVNYYPSLYVGMKVFLDTGSGPTQVGSLIHMTNLVHSLYVASFTPSVVGAYTFSYAVYTDGTYSTVDTNFEPGAICEQCIDPSSYLINLTNLTIANL